ncbi:MAG: hypothetical protein QNJ18_24420 [Xenococcaceae cyanobacterium MO_167.B52]|nr:hypothetical protein [Xenococcaceae cyanobacterium MO_167.B52]
MLIPSCIRSLSFYSLPSSWRGHLAILSAGDAFRVMRISNRAVEVSSKWVSLSLLGARDNIIL